MGALTGAFTWLPPRIEPLPLVIDTGPAAMAIPVPGIANAALNTATFITPVAHGDIFITAPELDLMTGLDRQGVPLPGCPVP
jgi:hypothetical protein